jgi:hypothetical protein
MTTVARGTFEIQMKAEPPYDVNDGITLGRFSFDKTFGGDLVGNSVVQMIGARTPVEASAGYVAIERVVATLAGRAGSFVLQHAGTMNRGVLALSVSVVPDSGTGALSGLAGQMTIDVVGGKHFYVFEYTLT